MTSARDDQTLQFYASESASYAARSDAIGPSKRLAAFLGRLRQGANVLDLGCGAARDAQAMIAAGFDATAVDGSAEMAAEAEKRLGRPVRVLLFEELDYIEAFDGIWANASLLHVPRAGLADVLTRVHRALKPGGLLFASFKSGGLEGRDGLGRFYNYLEADEATKLLNAAGSWASLSINEGRGSGYDGADTRWIECWLQKAT